jgi:FkbM family methyltransferase
LKTQVLLHRPVVLSHQGFEGPVAATTHQQETKMVADFFGPTSGFFVEVGANEPRLRSQSWHLEQAGWRGLLIEPQPDLAQKLRDQRRVTVVEAACSSPQNAGRSLPFHVAGPLSSLDRSGMAPGTQPEKVINVATRTLGSILDEAGVPTDFEFLSIDVEGHEVEVLRGLDLSRWRPRLIMIEDHVATLATHRYLRDAKYRIIRRYENNGWYVPSESTAAMALGDIWEVARKYYLALPARKVRNVSRRLRGKIVAQ